MEFLVALIVFGIAVVALIVGLFVSAIRGQSRAPQSPPVAARTPAGWYPDPYGVHQLRWFDGSSWREIVADNGVESIDAPPPS